MSNSNEKKLLRAQRTVQQSPQHVRQSSESGQELNLNGAKATSAESRFDASKSNSSGQSSANPGTQQIDDASRAVDAEEICRCRFCDLAKRGSLPFFDAGVHPVTAERSKFDFIREQAASASPTLAWQRSPDAACPTPDSKHAREGKRSCLQFIVFIDGLGFTIFRISRGSAMCCKVTLAFLVKHLSSSSSLLARSRRFTVFGVRS